jgi:hypothetical protein
MINRPPVVLFVYKRPGRTTEFLERIWESGTTHLYLFADGPKSSSDRVLTDRVKTTIEHFATLHPELRLSVHYAPKNLGLKLNIVTGLNHVFRHEPSAIILEDDCLPSPDFFKFTASMLKKYAGNDQVMSVTGTSVGRVGEYSYDFCRYQHCWGWGTWARAWRLYDADLSQFTPHVWAELTPRVWPSRLMRCYWYQMLTMTKAGWLNTWDFQWSYTHFLHHGLAIYPMVNLISNIGFDSAATNTKQAAPVAGITAGALSWPLQDPPEVRENLTLSALMERKFYRNWIAILGMMRQYFYWRWSGYAHRT